MCCHAQIREEFEAAVTHAYLGPRVQEDELPWALEVRQQIGAKDCGRDFRWTAINNYCNHACADREQVSEAPPCVSRLPLLAGGGASTNGEGGGPARAHRPAHKRTAAARVSDFEHHPPRRGISTCIQGMMVVRC